MQADILKEFIAQKEYIFPPRPSMRIVVDMIRYCTEHMPKWNSISISGYHIREAGSTAAQELAFTLRDGIEYVQWCVDAGMDVDSFAPRLSLLLQLAQRLLRGDRQVPRGAPHLGAHDEGALRGEEPALAGCCRFHTQTAGVSLTAQQPYNNVVRTALQALAGVLGGTQSLHTNSLDEALALPTEEAVTIALRTQQIIAHESGVVNTADPLGGSYFVEKLTNDIEAEALEYFRKIDAMGGMVAAVERGFPQREIQEAAFQFQQAVERKEKIIVGVNDYVMDEKPFPILYIDETVARGADRRASSALQARRATTRACSAALAALQDAARGTDNLMYPILEAVARLRHARRDVRRAARGLGRVRRAADLLMTAGRSQPTARSAC